jgi:hypothetical protein
MIIMSEGLIISYELRCFDYHEFYILLILQLVQHLLR